MSQTSSVVESSDYNFTEPKKTPIPASNFFQHKKETAVVYCEGHFGENNGKTANGLVRESRRFKILSVIDSTKGGQDSGAYLYGVDNGIPICHSMKEALSFTDSIPDYFIYGLAPSEGRLSLFERELILEAMCLGMNIINGLHEFLTDDPQFIQAAKKFRVHIIDVRKPRPSKHLHLFSNKISQVTCPRIAVMGTDSAIGKRTTANALARALQHYGLEVVIIATGQTGLIQGARYGVALDAVPSQFCAGELESVIIEAYEKEAPDLIIVEGQGALSHPSYCTSASIIRGACPDAIILQHAPARVYRSDSPQIPMPELSSEIQLIEQFSKVSVIGITLNNQGMDEKSIRDAVAGYKKQYQLPVTELFFESEDVLLEMVLEVFPQLKR